MQLPGTWRKENFFGCIKFKENGACGIENWDHLGNCIFSYLVYRKWKWTGKTWIAWPPAGKHVFEPVSLRKLTSCLKVTRGWKRSLHRSVEFIYVNGIRLPAKENIRIHTWCEVKSAQIEVDDVGSCLANDTLIVRFRFLDWCSPAMFTVTLKRWTLLYEIVPDIEICKGISKWMIILMVQAAIVTVNGTGTSQWESYMWTVVWQPPINIPGGRGGGVGCWEKRKDQSFLYSPSWLVLLGEGWCSHSCPVRPSMETFLPTWSFCLQGVSLPACPGASWNRHPGSGQMERHKSYHYTRYLSSHCVRGW